MHHLFKALHSLVARAPWHSEQQHLDVLDGLRKAEAGLTGHLDGYVSPLPHLDPAPPPPAVVGVNVPQPPTIDYTELAKAIVAQQEAAAEQQRQAAAAFEDHPGFEPPSPVVAPAAEVHEAAAELSADNPLLP